MLISEDIWLGKIGSLLERGCVPPLTKGTWCQLVKWQLLVKRFLEFIHEVLFQLFNDLVD